MLQNEKLVKQLVYWSQTSEFTGVLGESLRLMAWLIKHAYQHKGNDGPAMDDTGLRKFVAIEGAVASLVGMLASTHLVMQNEALIALSILTTIFHSNTKSEDSGTLDRLLIEAGVGSKLAEQITLNGESMTKEIVENLQTFVKQLHGGSESLVTHLREHNIDELLKTIPSLVEYCTL